MAALRTDDNLGSLNTAYTRARMDRGDYHGRDHLRHPDTKSMTSDEIDTIKRWCNSSQSTVYEETSRFDTSRCTKAMAHFTLALRDLSKSK